MSRLPDYNDLWDEHQRKVEAELEKLPKCDYCNKPIDAEYLYDINGDLVCEECLNDNFRKNVEDYIR